MAIRRSYGSRLGRWLRWSLSQGFWNESDSTPTSGSLTQSWVEYGFHEPRWTPSLRILLSCRMDTRFGGHFDPLGGCPRDPRSGVPGTPLLGCPGQGPEEPPSTPPNSRLRDPPFGGYLGDPGGGQKGVKSAKNLQKPQKVPKTGFLRGFGTVSDLRPFMTPKKGSQIVFPESARPPRLATGKMYLSPC